LGEQIEQIEQIVKTMYMLHLYSNSDIAEIRIHRGQVCIRCPLN